MTWCEAITSVRSPDAVLQEGKWLGVGAVREQCLMVQRLSLGDGNALGVLVNVLNAPKLKTYAVQFTQ